MGKARCESTHNEGRDAAALRAMGLLAVPQIPLVIGLVGGAIAYGQLQHGVATNAAQVVRIGEFVTTDSPQQCPNAPRTPRTP